MGHWVSRPQPTALHAVRSMADVARDIMNDLTKLQRETSQTDDFWYAVMSQAVQVAAPTEDQPSVVLFVVPPGLERAAVCLSHQVTDVVAKAFSPHASAVKHDTSQHGALSWREHKIALERSLSNVSRTHAAVVYNVERLHGGTATMLHPFLDNTTARTKRVLIALLLEVPEEVSPDADLTSLVAQRLGHLWAGHLSRDQLPGLLSRVAPVCVLVAPEAPRTLATLCPL